MRSTVLDIALVFTFAAAAFAAAYFGGGALNQAPEAQAAGAAAKAPVLVVDSTVPALRTPTPQAHYHPPA